MDIRTAVRVEFSRDSRVKYLSHLDLMRVFERAVRRSGIPVRYSYGFNPHADMVFGMPLQVGVTADAECLDIGLEFGTGFACGAATENGATENGNTVSGTSENGSAENPSAGNFTAEYTAEALRRQLPPGLGISRAAIRETKENAMAQITHASYIMGVADTEPGCLTRAVELFLLPGPRIVRKATKKASREVDIAPLVNKLEARDTDIIMTVSAGSTDNVKPDMVLDALRELYHTACAPSPGSADFRKAALHRTGIFIEYGGELLCPLDPRVLLVSSLR